MEGLWGPQHGDMTQRGWGRGWHPGHISMHTQVLICPDKRRPEENKDKALLAYTAQVRGVQPF